MARLSSRFNALLLIALVLSALALVTAQQRARTLFVDLEHAQQQGRQLETRWNQLQLEQSALTKHSLIDQMARNQLHMTPTTPAQTQYLELPNAANAVTRNTRAPTTTGKGTH